MTTILVPRSELISRVYNVSSGNLNTTYVFPAYFEGGNNGRTLRVSRLGIATETPTEDAMVFVSHAQGAVFAALALKFVQVGRPFFFISAEQ
jgi:hypothetical protein